ncbi:phage tail protein, partial [Bacillus thuringiensis]|nr:phage tail protein [Bacillus thuringiensis]
YTLDKAKGGAIEASISGLGAEPTIVYASNVPFYVSAKGTGETTVEFNTFDIMAGGAYNAVLGIEAVEGINVVGENTEAPYISIVFESQNGDGDTVYMRLTEVRLAHPDIALN